MDKINDSAILATWFLLQHNARTLRENFLCSEENLELKSLLQEQTKIIMKSCFVNEAAALAKAKVMLMARSPGKLTMLARGCRLMISCQLLTAVMRNSPLIRSDIPILVPKLLLEEFIQSFEDMSLQGRRKLLIQDWHVIIILCLIEVASDWSTEIVFFGKLLYAKATAIIA